MYLRVQFYPLKKNKAPTEIDEVEGLAGEIDTV